MTYVALLRGINVGGKRKVEMKQLKVAFEIAGMKDVLTYINSGNVIFRSEVSDTIHLVQVLEAAILDTFGFPVLVFLRDTSQINAVVEALPECWVDNKDTKCDVMFLAEHVDSKVIADQFKLNPEFEELRWVPGALLWCVERSNATKSGLLKISGTELYANMTVRNCNTVRKLGALMTEK